MIFSRAKNKTTITLLQKECKRLERERNESYAKLEEIKKYRQDYEELIEDVRKLKIRYEQLIAQNKTITEHYKAQLEQIVNAN